MGRCERAREYITWMNKKRQLARGLCVLALVLSIYPLCVLFYTWGCVFRSDLGCGRNGPLDAYRHTLASAVVSYTLGEWAVNLTTSIMETKGKDSNRMDSHNNLIGARIGSKSKSFLDLEPSVRKRVLDGTVNSTDENQITWLPKEKWSDARVW